MATTLEDIQLEKARREKEYRRSRPGPLEFRGANLRFLESTSHEVMLAGPAETGKSVTACHHMHDLLSRHKKARGVMLRKTRKSLMSTVHETYQQVIERSNVQPKPYGGENPEWYDYPNGSRLYLGGMDNPDKILSGERDFIYVCQAEELELNEWETLTTRATGRAGATDQPQVFGDCNPGPPTHWILHRPSLKVIESRHVDNPRLYGADGTLTAAGVRSMGILEALTGVLRERLYQGRWVAADGLVFNFDKAQHWIEAFPIPFDWPRYRTIDFGFKNPFACLWAALDPDGGLHIYRQHYHTEMTVVDHVKVIDRVEKIGPAAPEFLNPKASDPFRERIKMSLADHDAEDRATLAANGIITIAAPKAVSTGIEAVEKRLRLQKNGRPSLYVHRDGLVMRDDELHERRQPVCLEQEFDVYAYPKAADGKPQKEAPIKMYDHGMDPLRYLCLWLETGARGAILR